MPSFKRKRVSFKLQRGKDGGSRLRKSKNKALYFWTCEDVIKWLKKHCGQYYQLYGETFREHDINGKFLWFVVFSLSGSFVFIWPLHFVYGGSDVIYNRSFSFMHIANGWFHEEMYENQSSFPTMQKKQWLMDDSANRYREINQFSHRLNQRSIFLHISKEMQSIFRRTTLCVVAISWGNA